MVAEERRPAAEPAIEPEVCARYSWMATEWARELLEEGRFLTLDSETTGLSKDAQFVELAIVEHDGSPEGRVLLNLRIRPSCPIDAEAVAVHGHSMEYLAHAPTFAEAHPLIVGALERRRVVVYNAAFDRRIYAAHLRRDKLGDAPLYPGADRRYPWECAMFWWTRLVAVPPVATKTVGGQGLRTQPMALSQPVAPDSGRLIV